MRSLFIIFEINFLIILSDATFNKKVKNLQKVE